uniref:Methyltransferase domain-containing protein n=1 Tax=Trieres chinensis TaxID=1514140 RepID=A0A7S1Z9A6_TRICV
MPQYGDRDYWDERYALTESNPFDWLCDYDQLEPLLNGLVRRDERILVVGCGDAPFSPDLYFRGGYANSVHFDYSRVVIARQMERYPDMDWRIGDALDMRFSDRSFDVVIDKR